MNKFIESFPAGYTPNDQQDFVLRKIGKAAKSGKKFIVLNLPTGVGKSFISMAAANQCRNITNTYRSYVLNGLLFDETDEWVDEIGGPDEVTFGCGILTMTKSLQDQYNNLFPDGVTLKGKGNYECYQMPGMPCDIGPCTFDSTIKHKCKMSNLCPYYAKRTESLLEKAAFYSYSMFQSLPPCSKYKEVLVCDEASELEHTLVQQNTVKFDFNILKKLGVVISATPSKQKGKEVPYDSYITWIKEMVGPISSAFNDIKIAISKKKKKDIKQADITKYRVLQQYVERCLSIVETLRFVEYIVEVDTGSITFKPYKVDYFANELFKKCELVILMSATIIDHKNFTKQLGIKENEYEYIEAPSPFDPKKAPIYLSDSHYVTYATKNVVVPKLAKMADLLCKNHHNQKGIIHTHSLDITNTVKKELGTGRFLYREEGRNNELIIRTHTDSKDATVLVSPSLTHGVDLKGDLGEFAIIMKAPYLPLGDKRIKRICDEDKDWYVDNMLSTLIQMCGRTIRSKDDTSVTYILDGTVSRAIRDNLDKLPKYFVDRIQ